MKINQINIPDLLHQNKDKKYLSFLLQRIKLDQHNTTNNLQSDDIIIITERDIMLFDDDYFTWNV